MPQIILVFQSLLPLPPPMGSLEEIKILSIYDSCSVCASELYLHIRTTTIFILIIIIWMQLQFHSGGEKCVQVLAVFFCHVRTLKLCKKKLVWLLNFNQARPPASFERNESELKIFFAGWLYFDFDVKENLWLVKILSQYQIFPSLVFWEEGMVLTSDCASKI